MRVEEFYLSDSEQKELVSWMISEGFVIVAMKEFDYRMMQFIRVEDLPELCGDEEYNGECLVVHKSYLQRPLIVQESIFRDVSTFALFPRCGPYIVFGLGKTYHRKQVERNTGALFYEDFYYDAKYENRLPLTQQFFDAYERILGRITPLRYKYVDPVTQRPFWISKGTCESVKRGEYSLMLLSEPYHLEWPPDRV